MSKSPAPIWPNTLQLSRAKASQRVGNLEEEIRLLAHAEFERRREYPAEHVDMAQMLIDLGKTKRTYESVRKIRRAPKYKEFYAALGAASGLPKGNSCRK